MEEAKAYHQRRGEDRRGEVQVAVLTRDARLVQIVGDWHRGLPPAQAGGYQDTLQPGPARQHLGVLSLEKLRAIRPEAPGRHVEVPDQNGTIT